MLTLVSPGSTVTIETYFYEKGFTPFKVLKNQPPYFEMRTPSPNNQLVLSGTAEQDIDNPARWSAVVTIPQDAPQYPENQKYYITWVAKNKVSVRRNIEYFSVFVTDDSMLTTTDRILIKNKPLHDMIFIPSHLKIEEDAIQCELQDAKGNSFKIPNVVKSHNTPTHTAFSIATNGLYGANTSCNDGQPFIVAWEYEANNMPQMEYHFVYIVDNQALGLMNELRKLIDKARNDDINVNLALTEVDLIHYILRGLNRVNSTNPPTAHALDTLPAQLRHFVLYAAAAEAAIAQRLAEGVSVFDFGGQSVTLNVDRTAAWDSFLGSIEQQLSQDLPSMKKTLARSAGPGVLRVQPSSSMNRFYNASSILARLNYNSDM